MLQAGLSDALGAEDAGTMVTVRTSEDRHVLNHAQELYGYLPISLGEVRGEDEEIGLQER